MIHFDNFNVNFVYLCKYWFYFFIMTENNKLRRELKELRN